MRKLLLLFLAAGLMESAGAVPIPIDSVSRNSDGVILRMRPGVLKIEVCTGRIIHVVYSPTGTLPERTSFVVTREWTPVPFQVEGDPDAVVVSTDQVRVRIDKASGAIHFMNIAGQPILDEPADGGKSMILVTVNHEKSYAPEQTFVAPSDEFIWGLGQHPQGTWNWRGMPIELRQLNTEIAIPMLVSSKGYGLLWDNASLTDFNPVDQQVPVDPVTHAGTFATIDEGDYVFMVKDGDRKGEIGIKVGDQVVADIKNIWVTYAISGEGIAGPSED